MELYKRVLEKVSLVLNCEDVNVCAIRNTTAAFFSVIVGLCFSIGLCKYSTNLRVLYLILKIVSLLFFVCLLWSGVVEVIHSIVYGIVERKYYS
jgi:hypothetical protein